MRIQERRIVQQEWYETDSNKTGWDSNGWYFWDTGDFIDEVHWDVIEHNVLDKFGNPIIGVAERLKDINEL